jgi:ATP-binding cassette, subfamily F, member 3
VQSRVKALDKIELINDVIDDAAKVNFKFNFSQQPGKFILTLEDVSKAYGPKTILSKTNAMIERGDKIALIGANGKGKSTLLRIIDGSEPIDGDRKLGYNVKDTFYAQHQLESLDVEATILEELKHTGTAKTEMELRSILGCFLFSGEEAFKKIKVLSGGEKSRVALAKVLISEANFLLLDEPTNHLDMLSVNILIQALQQYEGTYVVVSHDRYFVSEIANKIWYIENEEIKVYPGTFDEYETWMETRNLDAKSEPSQKETIVKKSVIAPKAEVKPKVSFANQAEIKKTEANIAKIETEIEALENEKANLENKLADPEIFANQKAFIELNNNYIAIENKLKTANKNWEENMLQLEALQK